jgi:hypothetical protein
MLIKKKKGRKFSLWACRKNRMKLLTRFMESKKKDVGGFRKLFQDKLDKFLEPTSFSI